MPLHWTPYTLELRRPFAIATGTSLQRPTLLVELRDPEQRVGLGEATPIRYLGGTLESVGAELEGLRASLDRLGPDPLRGVVDVESGMARIEATIDRLVLENPGARSGLTAVDLALHDLLGKRLGLGLGELLGLPERTRPPSAWTVGIAPLEERLEVAREGIESGMKVLKLKVGSLSIEEDAAALAALRSLHPGPLMVDANGGWTLSQAIAAVKLFAGSHPLFVEQPIPRGNPEGLRRIKEQSPLPIVADEDALDPEDLPGLVGAVDGINIKLAKCGGLVRARRMITKAREEGWLLMLGCMVESSVALTAAGFLSALVDHADLDAALLTANDPYEGLKIEAGRSLLPTGPGLGLVWRRS